MKMRFLEPALLFALAACGTSTRTSGQSSKANAADQAGLSRNPSFITTPVATLDSPWAMDFLPNSNLSVVTEKPGRIWLVDLKSGAKKPVSGAPRVTLSDQGGLLDVRVSPTYAADRQVYLTYAEPSPEGGSSLALARARLALEASGARLEGLTRIWHDPEGGEGGQFGAIIVFAPDKKSLYLSSGERQRFTPAQDPSQPLGKILHLTLDGKPAPGNPMAGKVGTQAVTIIAPPRDTLAARTARGRTFAWPGPNLTPAETWSSGHRNPYGLAFDKDGRLWETEMGPRGGDELNLIVAGRNYGWPLVSNGKNYDGEAIPPHSSRPDLEAPKLYWVPSISPTSLLIYSGKLFPQWAGNGFIGTLTGKGLVRVTLNGTETRKAEEYRMPRSRIRFVGEGPDGAIYLLEDGAAGRMLRLTPAQTRR